jgi:hypothetical protein
MQSNFQKTWVSATGINGSQTLGNFRKPNQTQVRLDEGGGLVFGLR